MLLLANIYLLYIQCTYDVCINFKNAVYTYCNLNEPQNLIIFILLVFYIKCVCSSYMYQILHTFFRHSQHVVHIFGSATRIALCFFVQHRLQRQQLHGLLLGFHFNDPTRYRSPNVCLDYVRHPCPHFLFPHWFQHIPRNDQLPPYQTCDEGTEVQPFFFVRHTVYGTRRLFPVCQPPVVDVAKITATHKSQSFVLQISEAGVCIVRIQQFCTFHRRCFAKRSRVFHVIACVDQSKNGVRRVRHVQDTAHCQ